MALINLFFSFVGMIEYEGAEQLRSALVNGRLYADGASLIVCYEKGLKINTSLGQTSIQTGCG